MAIAEEVRGAQDMESFRSEIAGIGCAPLWEVLKGMVPAEPRPLAQPHTWRWQQMRPRMIETGSLISAELAERRVLMLCNPGLQDPYATDTLYAGVQLILPGEVARAHRHSQAALRFVLEGEGGFTAVDGYRTEMRRGDFILTPPGTWHDHGNDGDQPVLWLDGLDVPLVTFLHASFREEYEHEVFPRRGEAARVDDRYGGNLLPIDPQARESQSSPLFSYPYERTRAVLQRLAAHGQVDACHGANVRYANPVDGGPVMPTISASMRLVPAGQQLDWFQSVDSAVLVGVEGETQVEIAGAGTHRIGPNDIFALPGWCRWRLGAGSADDAIVFSYSSRPVYEKLGLYREKRG
jgi:gentisate 1,2-dioxygenase